MTTLYVRRNYCSEHAAAGHYCDENGRCFGETLKDVENLGYSWPRHLGNGWFRMNERHSSPLPSEWEILAVGRSQSGDSDFDF
jgi:hypothetical protein